MRRITKENINTPEFFDNHFSGDLFWGDEARLRRLIKYFYVGAYLEIGCFDSPLPLIVADEYESEVTAMDFSPRVIETLKKLYPRDVVWMIGDAMNIKGHYDYIVAGEVIEHMEDPEAFIKGCMDALKEDGCLAVSTPLNESDRREVGGRQHLWSFSEQDFIDWGFETEIMNKTIIAWKRK